MSVITRYWINNTSYFAIDNDRILTNATMLIPGTYWLEVKAYDPYDNYCAGFLEISVKLPKEDVGFILPAIPLPITFFLIGSISTLSLFGIKAKIKKDH